MVQQYIEIFDPIESRRQLGVNDVVDIQGLFDGATNLNAE